jgi:16S rRNA C967 or C1407 C5-methylase (RsmB/RsmF family)
MAEWLDDLVSKTKLRYEDQRTKEQKIREQLQRAEELGAKFFSDLADWLKANTEQFNQKFESQVFSIQDNRSQYAINVISHPDPIHTWSARVTYTPVAHNIDILRNPGGATTYTLALTEDGSRIVALYGNNTDPSHGLDVNLLGQNIMQSMLIP